MNYVEFGGGLGDVINQCYRFGGYDHLGKTKEKTAILLLCHNKFALEIFEQHPNNNKFEMHYEGYPSFAEANIIRHRLREKGYHPVSYPAPNPSSVTFYPTESDKILLSTLPPKYVAFQPFSGCSDRDIPPQMVNDIDTYFASLSIPLVMIGRNYERKAKLTREETTSKTMINTVDKLTVPGTIELVSRSSLFIGGHSSMILLAWHRRVNNFMLIPQAIEDKWFQGHNEWNFGKDYPNSKRCAYDHFTISRLHGLI